MTYNLGVDIGIGSTGYAGVQPEKEHILFSGVRIFDAAENPKDGKSLALPRREKRAARRITRRRAKRKVAVKRLFLEYGLCADNNDLADILHNVSAVTHTQASPWQLRKEGLERKLSTTQWMRVLYHISKRRGFQSTRKGAMPSDSDDDKKALSGAKDLEAAMEKANAKTVGAYLATLNKQRNGDGSYECFVTRDQLRQEVDILFEAQKKFGNPYTQDLFRDAFKDVAFYQRPLASCENLVGQCSLEPKEKRAPKCSYTAELFILWTKLNNCRIKHFNEERPLTPDEKLQLFEKAHAVKKLTYAQVRKILSLHNEARFNVGYRQIDKEDNSWEAVRERSEKQSTFAELKGYHALKAALANATSNEWQALCQQKRAMLDEAARVLSFYPDPDQQRELLQEAGFADEQMQTLIQITSFNKTVDLSLKAIEQILPFMEQGMRYDEACAQADYHHSKKTSKGLSLIPLFEDIRNPVVNRALAQTRKVINACIRQYGMPERIIIELSREVGKPFRDRKQIEREQKKNEAARLKSREAIAEIYGTDIGNITGEQILKYRLWAEQGGFCPYSGAQIDIATLRDPVATQIDHILPYSRSFEDGYMNKVLCLSSENQQKRAQTAYEYMDGKGMVSQLEAFISQYNIPKKKAERLLKSEFDPKAESAFKDRAMNDTRYIARLLKNHLECSLPESVKIQVCNGMLTAQLRRMWGFPQKSRSNDRHHAVDAMVLACVTQSMVQQCAQASIRQQKRKPVVKPWPSFREHVLESASRIFVSRMPNRKVSGAAHEDTVRSIRYDKQGERYIIQRIKLSSLKLKTLEQLVDKQRNVKLYDVLRTRLEAYDDKPDKAFAEPVYMPTRSGKVAPQIHGVNIITSEKSGVEINGGLASNGDMVRVDVFARGGKYFLVPIYVHHLAGNKPLPQCAIAANKPESEWTLMHNDEFIFSLATNDLVRVKSKKEDYVGYYVGTHRGTGAITLRAHDSDPSFGKDGKQSVGVKTLLAFEKYTVDLFGNIHPMLGSGGIRERRHGVAQCDDSKTSEVIA